ncbi:MAG: cell division protein FtsW [Acetobacter sp.]|nr:cell division protein FtsW [Acetobacter sp.]
MSGYSRLDNSSFGQWWNTIDRGTLICTFILIGFGYILVMAASPAVALRIGASRNIFIFKQVFFLTIAGGIVVLTSTLSRKAILQLSLWGGFIMLCATVMTLFHGLDIKGARRWIALPVMSLQPSEFLKPCFAVVTGWLFAQHNTRRYFPGLWIALILYAFIAFLLQAQPDIGMLTVITSVLLTQFFVNGLSLALVGAGGLVMVLAGISAFFIFPHVHSRMERFLHPNLGDHYQIDTALRAFGNGGFLGRGPGEGRVKNLLPDAHADFVFAVAGEEYGFVVCMLILGLFLTIVIRTLLRMIRNDDPFTIIAATGLITGFGLQAFINMASSLHLIPTKGMTLPFISYGGSSAMSVTLTIGMTLALTRKRPSLYPSEYIP